MAMKRFPSNKLMKIEGIELQTKLSKCTCESEVEDTFKNYFMISSMMNIRTVKVGIPNSRSATDGVMEWAYVTSKNTQIFNVLNESKFRKRGYGADLYSQVCQALHYNYLLPDYNFKAFIVSSESYIGYFFADEIESLILEMNKRFASCGLPPSKSYSKVKYLSPKMESYLESKIVWIDPKFELHKMIKDIYKHCIKR
jgi:hypothetical protein